MDLSLTEVLLSFLIVFGAATIQGAIGFGYAVIAVPLLRLVEPGLTPIPQIFLAMLLATAQAWREWPALQKSSVSWILLGRIPGSVVGAWVLSVVAIWMLDVITSVVVLSGVAVSAFRLSVVPTRLTWSAAGVVSGFTGTASAMSGPPLALIFQDTSRREARATLGFIFAIGGVLSLLVLLLAGHLEWIHLLIALALAVPTWFGFRASSVLNRYADEAHLKLGVLVLSGLAGALLLSKGLQQWL